MEVKAPAKDKWPQISEFLQEKLRPKVNWTLKQEYPLAFAPSNLGNIRFIENDKQILSHAVVKPNLVKTHYHLFKVGFIGSVVTDEAHRGKGYSQAIINSCLEAASEQSCDFAMLWTDLFAFYGKMGFEIAGQEVAMTFNQNFTAPIKDSLKIMETNKIAPESLLRVYDKHNLKTLRKSIDIADHLKIPQSRVITAWNQATNELEAYCVIGKGADFANYIHEWGGKVSSILSILAHVVNKEAGDYTLISPPQCTNLISQMESHGAKKYHGVLGMIKILNSASFCKKIKKGARSLGYDSFVFEHHDNKYYFGYGEEIYQTDSEQDIVRLVFGPLKPEQIHKFSPKALEALNEIFPIPFWVWGWDSI